MREILLPLFLCAAGGCSSSGSGANGDASNAPPPSGAPDDAGSTTTPSTCERGTAANLVVPTASGAVKGTVESGVNAYLGIPYAAPPVGPLRFRAPSPHACFGAAPLHATAEGPDCVSFAVTSGQLDVTQVAGREDCLTLNVWTPAGLPTTSSLPVLVFSHGGGYISRIGEDHDGAMLAHDTNMVVVTYNYRLGQLGYLAHPALAKEHPDEGTGNYGVLDTLAALRWVKDNIAGFGGDPKRVVLSGQSAGGGEVAAAVTSPLGRGLASGALVESGFYSARTLADAEGQGARIATAVGCGGAADVAACLRGVPAEKLYLSYPRVGVVLQTDSYGPTVDGAVLPSQPHDAMAAGALGTMPVVFGANHDEVTPFTATQADLDAYATASFGADASTLEAQYPVASYPSIGAAFAAMATDYQFVCPMRRASRVAAKAGANVHTYFLSYVLDGAPPSLAYSFHKLELLFFFRETDQLGPVDAKDLAFQDLVTGYFSRFIATGDPNASGSSLWGRATPTGGYLALGSTPTFAAGGLHDTACDLIEPHLP